MPTSTISISNSFGMKRHSKRMWVSVRIGYPVLFRADVLCGQDGNRRIEGVADQFQWDVEIDPDQLEPQIPAGYTLQEWPS